MNIINALLRVRLPWKIAGANALMIIFAGWLVSRQSWGFGGTQLSRLVPQNAWVMLILLVSIGMNVSLVLIALRPLRILEATAARVAAGDLDARVPSSRVADQDMARISETFNDLIEALSADRARMRQLAAEVIRSGDRERDDLSRALHDSSAQSLAAVAWQAGAALQDPELPPSVRAHLEAIREAATGVMDEVRSLAQLAYPRVLDDLGLSAALTALARQERNRTGIDVTVRVVPGVESLPKATARVLYRVAQEAVMNAVRHAEARTIEIAAGATHGAVWLSVQDDGRGFDPVTAERREGGMGLFTMRERLALASGTLEITSGADGTLIKAQVPLAVASAVASATLAHGTAMDGGATGNGTSAGVSSQSRHTADFPAMEPARYADLPHGRSTA